MTVHSLGKPVDVDSAWRDERFRRGIIETRSEVR
jgi:hypothetical protein